MMRKKRDLFSQKINRKLIYIWFLELNLEISRTKSSLELIKLIQFYKNIYFTLFLNSFKIRSFHKYFEKFLFMKRNKFEKRKKEKREAESIHLICKLKC